jgi:hypothetical protein
MSNKLYGNAATLSKVLKPLDHEFAKMGTCPVDIPSLRNRKTTVATIRKNAKQLGGFDPRAWDAPTIAVVEETGKEYLYDGDHSRWMFRGAYPDKKEMPCRRVKVKDRAELSRLFVHRNKRGKKDLTAEEIFVHEYLGGYKAAIDTEKALSSASLKVSLGTGEPDTTVGKFSGKEVPIKGFRIAMNKSSKRAVTESSLIIQSVWSSDSNVAAELLAGIAIAVNTPSVLGNKKWNDFFKSFLSAHVELGNKQKEMSSAFKNEGGKIGNQDHNCVALGFLIGFRRWGMKHGHFTAKTYRKYLGVQQDHIKSTIDAARHS